jgi:hypothetical protein
VNGSKPPALARTPVCAEANDVHEPSGVQHFTKGAAFQPPFRVLRIHESLYEPGAFQCGHVLLHGDKTTSRTASPAR